MLPTVTPNDLLETKPRPHPEAAMEKVGGRWMVATPDDQLHYFVAEGGEDPSDVGDRVIDLADGTRTVRQIAQAICGEFEVEEAVALQDTTEFVRQLIERKVLTAQAVPAPATDPGAPPSDPR